MANLNPDMTKADLVYHACLDKWDEVRKGMDVEDAAEILINVHARLGDKIDRDEQYACQVNAAKNPQPPKGPANDNDTT